MKEFDWGHYAQKHSPQKTLWLQNNHNKKISEEQFVVDMKNLREYSKGKKLSTRYSPSYLKHQYKRLVTKFGFFV